MTTNFVHVKENISSKEKTCSMTSYPSIQNEIKTRSAMNSFRIFFQDHRAEPEGYRHRLRQPEAQVHLDQRPSSRQSPTKQERTRGEGFSQRSCSELHSGRRQQRCQFFFKASLLLPSVSYFCCLYFTLIKMFSARSRFLLYISYCLST